MSKGVAISNELRPAPRCPACQCETVRDIGSIASAIMFAGQNLGAPINGGRLFRCENCHLGFRYPRPPEKDLDVLYGAGCDDTWSSGNGDDRVDWQIATSWIRSELGGGRVIDVGCFDGGFLTQLNDGWRRYGIEIHPTAAIRARARGIEVVGTSFYQTPDRGEPYTLVTAFDVIEHVENPANFLRWLANLVEEGGYVVISTGNMDARSWALMGSRYWYCTIAEHISFVSPAWIKATALDLGLSMIKFTFFSHKRASFGVKATQFLKNALYKFNPTFAAWLRVHNLAGKTPVSKWPDLKCMPPVWDTAKDHFLVVLRKQPTT